MSLRLTEYLRTARTGCAVIWVLASLPITAMAVTPAFDSGGTGKAERLLMDAHRAAHHGHYTEAIADDTEALALLPSFGNAYWNRAIDEMDCGRYQEASADLDRVIAMRPDDMQLAMMRVKLALWQRDATTALRLLKVALALPLRTFRHQPFEAGTYETGNGRQFVVNGHMESHADEYTSIAEQLLHHDDSSIAAMDAMMKIEVQHPEYILHHYCYNAAMAGLLESAEIACQQSIAENSHDIGQYDSLGFVHLRMKQWDKAIADYNKSLDSRDDLTLSLYGRGVAKRAKGDIAGGNADIAAAQRGEPDIANIMRRLGVIAM
jgi:tetratricopeptide (TPR) repeat protein